MKEIKTTQEFLDFLKGNTIIKHLMDEKMYAIVSNISNDKFQNKLLYDVIMIDSENYSAWLYLAKLNNNTIYLQLDTFDKEKPEVLLIGNSKEYLDALYNFFKEYSYDKEDAIDNDLNYDELDLFYSSFRDEVNDLYTFTTSLIKTDDLTSIYLK